MFTIRTTMNRYIVHVVLALAAVVAALLVWLLPFNAFKRSPAAALAPSAMGQQSAQQPRQQENPSGTTTPNNGPETKQAESIASQPSLQRPARVPDETAQPQPDVTLTVFDLIGESHNYVSFTTTLVFGDQRKTMKVDRTTTCSRVAFTLQRDKPHPYRIEITAVQSGLFGPLRHVGMSQGELRLTSDTIMTPFFEVHGSSMQIDLEQQRSAPC